MPFWNDISRAFSAAEEVVLGPIAHPSTKTSHNEPSLMKPATKNIFQSIGDEFKREFSKDNLKKVAQLQDDATLLKLGVLGTAEGGILGALGINGATSGAGGTGGLGQLGSMFSSVFGAGFGEAEIEQLKALGHDIGEVQNILKKANEYREIANKIQQKQVELTTSLNDKEQKILETELEQTKAGKEELKMLREEVDLERTRALLEDTHFKTLIRQNVEHNIAEQNELHQDVIINNNLQALEKEERKVEDAINQLKTRLDAPSSAEDFIRDLKAFESTQASSDYLIENYDTLLSLNEDDILRVLSLVNVEGVLQLL